MKPRRVNCDGTPRTAEELARDKWVNAELRKNVRQGRELDLQKPMKLYIAERHIKAGKPGSFTHCAAALAMKEQWPEVIGVKMTKSMGHALVRLPDGSTMNYNFTPDKELVEFIGAYDFCGTGVEGTYTLSPPQFSKTIEERRKYRAEQKRRKLAGEAPKFRKPNSKGKRKPYRIRRV